MLPDEVREVVESWAIVAAETPGDWQAVRVETLAAVRAHLLAREAEVERLQAELGDYRTNGASAVRFAPNSAHWSNELKRLFGEDARTGIGVLEKWHCDSRARAEKAEALLRRHQSADVDADTTLYGDTEAHLSENSRG